MATNMKSLNGYGFDASALGGHDPSHYATSEDIQQVRNEIPTKLPNPNALTINGQSYDGSAAVDVTITGGGAGVEVDNTLTQSGKAADAKVVGDKLSELNQANAAQNTEIAKKANDADLAAVAKSGSYNDLTGKPTIPTVPSSLPNPNALTFTGAVRETYDGSAPKSVAIPTVPSSIKNPYKLKLSGAVTAEYDGSSEVSVEIPAGGGSTYELPVASATQLGGVQPVAKTYEMTQSVGVDAEGKLFTAAGSGGGRATKLVKLIEYVAGENAANATSIDFTVGEYPDIAKIVGTIIVYCIFATNPRTWINFGVNGGTAISLIQNTNVLGVAYKTGDCYFGSSTGMSSNLSNTYSLGACTARFTPNNSSPLFSNCAKVSGAVSSLKVNSYTSGWIAEGDKITIWAEVSE